MMKGINIQIDQDNQALFITNLEKAKGIEFRFCNFNKKRHSLENAETIGSVTLNEEQFIQLADYFNRVVSNLQEEKDKEEDFATVKFFEKRDEEKTEVKKAKKK